MTQRERGGVFVDLLAGIGIMVVLLAIVFAACFNSAGAVPARYGRGGGCNREGNCNDQRRCHGAQGECRGSFSPGPFDRSPVDAFNGNTVCMPGSTCYTGTSTTTRPSEAS